MGSIYTFAYAVFAAHGPELCFEKSSPATLHDPFRDGIKRSSLTEEGEQISGDAVYARLKIDHDNMFSAPKSKGSWFGRGWCMQERMLASRVLHFGGYCEEIFFECNTNIICECGRIGNEKTKGKGESRSLKSRQAEVFESIKTMPQLTLSTELASLSTNVVPEADREKKEKDREFFNGKIIELFITYTEAVEDYTRRGLTFPTDTLPAISSLMSRFSPHLGTYYAGLFQNHLLLALQWEALDTFQCTRHEVYVAPSFSWASREGGVIWYMDSNQFPTKESHEWAEVLGINCTLSGNDSFGMVNGGELRIRGYVTEMLIENMVPLSPDGRMTMSKGANVEGRRGRECFVTFDSKEDARQVEVGMSVRCLDVMRDREGIHDRFVSGLVLRAVDGMEGCYRRVGFSTMLAEHFDGSEREDITIV